jgi:hypothetical protein
LLIRTSIFTPAFHMVNWVFGKQKACASAGLCKIAEQIVVICSIKR